LARFVIHITGLLLLLSCYQTDGKAAERLTLTDEMLYQFGMHLYRTQEYYRAISEYKRLLYFFPESQYRETIRLQIGRAYMAGGDQREAMDYWQRLLQSDDPITEPPSRLLILYGISLLDNDRLKPFRLRQEKVDAAIDHLARVRSSDPDSRRVTDFVEEYRSVPPAATKSPLLAGSLSALLPGAGSVYTKRPREGLYTLFFTGLFALAAGEAFQHQQYPTGYFFGFFSLAFYGGGIYTAVNSAHRYNDTQAADRLVRLRKKHGIWFIPESTVDPGRF
jgi:tetratricopeptide (TPR) repeat protein